MKADIIAKISRLVGTVETLSESEVSHLLSLVRKYLEHLDGAEKKRYMLLKFFCDWSQHIAIDRCVPAMEILERLNTTIVRLGGVDDNARLIDEITRVISFPELRTEMEWVLRHMGLGSGVAFVQDQEKWKNFIRHFINIILDCPLEIPHKPHKKMQPFCERMAANLIAGKTHVVGFSITRVPRDVFGIGRAASGVALVCLMIVTSDTTRIVVPLTPEKILGWQAALHL